MKNSFKLGLLGLVIAASFSACEFGHVTQKGIDTLKADSLRKDSLAKVAAAAKPDSGKAKIDTGKKDTTKKK